MKQAVINSKQNAFKNLNIFNNPNEIKKDVKSTTAPDQVARPAENQPDISKENPPAKEFQPSPEVSPLFNRDNSPREHFAPMNNYYTPPPQQEVRYPTDSPFSVNSFGSEKSPMDPGVNTKWYGGDKSPIDPSFNPKWLGGDKSPMEMMDQMHPPPRPNPFYQGRNTNIESIIHQMQQNLHRHFYPQQHQPPSYNSLNNFNNQNSFNSHHSYSDEKISFPEENSKSDETWPPQSHVVPALNFKKPKGTWKWVPEEESQPRNSSETTSFESSGPHTFFESQRPQTSHDRPYSFDSATQSPYSHLYRHHPHHTTITPSTDTQRYPTGPAAWPSSGSDTLLSTEEYTTSKKENEESGKLSDIKILR